MSMDKVRISNAIGTSENEYQAPVAISVNGVAWGPQGTNALNPQVDTKKLTISPVEGEGGARTVNATPVGPRDQFTRPWRPGDRQPTEAEQWSKPDWFKDLPNTNIETGTGVGSGPSAIVGFVLGGVVKIGYPQGDQKQTRVINCVPGLVAYDIGPVLLGKGPGLARVSIAQESSGDAAGSFAVATEPGALVGPSVLGTPYEGNMPVFNIGVTTDMPKLYINARYTSVGSNQLVQIEAHDRV